MSIKSAAFRKISYQKGYYDVEEPDLAVSVKQLVARNLSRLLDEKGVSPSELARKIGVKPALVTRWRKGINLPDAENLDKIGETLGEPVSVLFVDDTQVKSVGISPEEAMRIVAASLGLEVRRKAPR